MASKLKSLLGLAGEEAPKAGHWMTTMREASQLPATQPTVNESVVNEMLNRPVSRRTVLEQGKNAATALSMGNKLGALADLVPETAAPARAAMPAVNYLDEVMSKSLEAMTPEGRKRIVSTWDMQPEELFEGHRELEHELADLKLSNPEDQKKSVDEVIDHLINKVLGPEAVSDDALDYANQLMTSFKALRLKGEKYKKLPDFWDLEAE